MRIRREILDRLVRAAIAGREARQAGEDLHVHGAVRAGDGDEIISAAAREHAVGRAVRCVSGARQSSSDRDQVLLRHADIEEAVGKCVAERQDVGVFAEVGGEPDDVGPRAAELRQRMPEGRFDDRSPTCRSSRPGPSPGCGRAQPWMSSASRSSSAPRSSHSPASTRMKCAFSRFSSVGTPLPGSVRSTIAFGLPPVGSRARAGRRRSLPCRCRRSPAFPSRRRATCRRPAPCRARPCRRPGCRCSRSARRDCRGRKLEAAIAASQVEPSCISPSESSTKTRAGEAA